MEDGVIHVYANKDSKEKLFPVADATTFFTDLHHILKVIAAGNTRTVCHHRLGLLEQKFNLHLMLNADKEFLAQKSAPHRDFYNVRKVDTHVHHSACMNQKHLLRFIKSKLRKEPDEVVIFRDGTYLTLREVFESLDLTGVSINGSDSRMFVSGSCDKTARLWDTRVASRAVRTFHGHEGGVNYVKFFQDGNRFGTGSEDGTCRLFDIRTGHQLQVYPPQQGDSNTPSPSVTSIAFSISGRLLFASYSNGDCFVWDTLLAEVVGLDLVDDESKPERRPTKYGFQGWTVTWAWLTLWL